MKDEVVMVERLEHGRRITLASGITKFEPYKSTKKQREHERGAKLILYDFNRGRP